MNEHIKNKKLNSVIFFLYKGREDKEKTTI